MFNVIDNLGKRQMMIIETNSCPSGQKSMPLLDESQKFNGYKTLIESLFEDYLQNKENTEVNGDLAVVFDKNVTENSAYSIVLNNLSNEKVWLVENLDDDENMDEKHKIMKWIDGVMYVRDNKNEWHPIRACLRYINWHFIFIFMLIFTSIFIYISYITQKPWKKIPLNTKTVILNPIAVCLAGGRNKIMAAYAYNLFNESQAKSKSGLSIRLPHSVINVNKRDIPALLESDKRLDGKCVVKVPYSNCGQGVYTIINKTELDEFMNINHRYDKFIVQSLIGDHSWFSSEIKSPEIRNYYHVGTIPDASQNIFVYDLRMIVTSNKNGFCPVSMNSRRARKPLVKDFNLNEASNLNEDEDAILSSWDMLGTNLSVKIDKNLWDTESERLLTMDCNDFNVLGLGMDDLIDAYIQTVFSVISIDKLCIELLDSCSGSSTNEKFGKFNCELFKELNPDDSLINEIRFY